MDSYGVCVWNPWTTSLPQSRGCERWTRPHGTRFGQSYPTTLGGIYRVGVRLGGNGLTSIRGRDKLSEQLARFLATPPEPSPEFLIISRIPAELPWWVRKILTACVVLGKQRAEVEKLATACEYTPDVLEHKLRRAGFRAPEDLLGIFVSLQAAWWREMLRESVTEVAAKMRFPSRQAFSNYFLRHAGFRPKAVADKMLYAAMLEQFPLKLNRPE
jgi:hypothetical protein